MRDVLGLMHGRVGARMFFLGGQTKIETRAAMSAIPRPCGERRKSFEKQIVHLQARLIAGR